jgi:hypothetical protein
MVYTLMTPNNIIPRDPITTPAEYIANGRAKLPEPTLALAKLKNVATTLVPPPGADDPLSAVCTDACHSSHLQLTAQPRLH